MAHRAVAVFASLGFNSCRLYSLCRCSILFESRQTCHNSRLYTILLLQSPMIVCLLLVNNKYPLILTESSAKVSTGTRKSRKSVGPALPENRSLILIMHCQALVGHAPWHTSLFIIHLGDCSLSVGERCRISSGNRWVSYIWDYIA